MEGSILELLAGHESLGYEQIAAHSARGPMMCALRWPTCETADLSMSSGSETCTGQTAKAASYWRLTDAGRRELARRRSQ